MHKARSAFCICIVFAEKFRLMSLALDLAVFETFEVTSCFSYDDA